MTDDNKITRKLDVICKLLAANILQGMPVNKQVGKLDSLGLKNKEIAEILGKSENQVKVTKSKLKSSKDEEMEDDE